MQKLNVSQLKSLRAGIMGTDKGPRVIGYYNFYNPSEYLATGFVVGPDGKIVGGNMSEDVSLKLRDETQLAIPI